jgi:hypothetical protein
MHPAIQGAYARAIHDSFEIPRFIRAKTRRLHGSRHRLAQLLPLSRDQLCQREMPQLLFANSGFEQTFIA